VIFLISLFFIFAFVTGLAANFILWQMVDEINSQRVSTQEPKWGWNPIKFSRVINAYAERFPGSSKIRHLKWIIAAASGCFLVAFFGLILHGSGLI
jgi:hypothetical protein